MSSEERYSPVWPGSAQQPAQPCHLPTTVNPQVVQQSPQVQQPHRQRPAAPLPKQRPARAFSTALPTALISALLASGITATVLHTETPAYAELENLTTTSSTVANASYVSTSGVGWQPVIANVADSVVAITANSAQGESVGSGFIIDQGGHVVTNNHVISGAIGGKAEVTLTDGRIYQANIVGTDSITDIAMLEILDPPANLQPAVLGDSSQVQVGDPILAVGNPLGLANTATTGIVSAINRPVVAGSDREQTTTNAIQIDASVNPGNSGGPIFNNAGQVIGIASSIASLASSNTNTTSGSIGLGFAIPINLAKNISEQLLTNGEAQHAFLGVMIQPGTATANGEARRGATIAAITDGSPAADAGLQPDDVVIAINDQLVDSAAAVTGYVREHSPGDTLKLQVIRNGEQAEIAVTLAVLDEITTHTTEQTPQFTFPEPPDIPGSN